MKVTDLIAKLFALQDSGIINGDTEISVPASPDKDYDRSSDLQVRVLRSKDQVGKEIILVDSDDSMYHGKIV